MQIQAGISRQRLERHLGQQCTVLVDGPSEEHPLVKSGRMATQAPEVDGVVWLDRAPEHLKAGDFCQTRITKVSDYDLVGEVIEE